MAKLSAHGQEIGRIEFSTYTKAYFDDGRILKNSGFGWKLHAKVKPGFSIAEAFQAARVKQAEFRAARPAYAAYVDELHALAGLSKRWKLAAAVELMPDDPDGVWSEACDGYGDNVSADVSDIVKLCDLYKAAADEARAAKALLQPA